MSAGLIRWNGDAVEKGKNGDRTLAFQGTSCKVKEIYFTGKMHGYEAKEPAGQLIRMGVYGYRAVDLNEGASAAPPCKKKLCLEREWQNIISFRCFLRRWG